MEDGPLNNSASTSGTGEQTPTAGAGGQTPTLSVVAVSEAAGDGGEAGGDGGQAGGEGGQDGGDGGQAGGEGDQAAGDGGQAGGEGGQAGSYGGQTGGGSVAVEERQSDASSSGCGLLVGNFFCVLLVNLAQTMKNPSALMALQ